jgi:hypothetical protein
VPSLPAVTTARRREGPPPSSTTGPEGPARGRRSSTATEASSLALLLFLFFLPPFVVYRKASLLIYKREALVLKGALGTSQFTSTPQQTHTPQRLGSHLSLLQTQQRAGSTSTMTGLGTFCSNQYKPLVPTLAQSSESKHAITQITSRWFRDTDSVLRGHKDLYWFEQNVPTSSCCYSCY